MSDTFGYCPESGMAYRLCDDGLWYALDIVSAEGMTAGQAGIVPLEPATPNQFNPFGDDV